MGRSVQGRSGRAGRGGRLGLAAVVAVMVLAGCGGPPKAPSDAGSTSSTVADPKPTSPSTGDRQPTSSGADEQQPTSSSTTEQQSTPPGPPGDTRPAANVSVLTGDAQRRRDGAPASAAREALAGFGIDLFRQVAGDEANVVVSPYSLYSVLAMVRAGAEGETARQLDAALHADGADEQGAALVTIDQALAAVNRDQVTIDRANQAWIQDGFEVRPEYLDSLAVQFGAPAVAAAFADAPDDVREAINAWVADRTRGLIKDLFPPDSITSGTRLALVNALYLKAAWVMPFSPVGPRPFTTADGGTVQAPIMSSSGLLQGAAGDGWASVTLPYAGGLAMTLLVPDAGEYDAVLDRLDPELLAEASGFGAAAPRNVVLTMPPFQTRSGPAVLDAMKALGVTDLFDASAADLSGMTGARDLFVSALVQQAVISVDENGTEAAAASGTSVAESAAPLQPLELTVDRPFLYWIADTTTGAPLFIGTVTDPTA